jgi:hypothetical protein
MCYTYDKFGSLEKFIFFMSKQNPLKQLDKTLFWDVRFDDLNIEENADFIIERVLSFGDVKDYQLLRKMYDYEKIKKAAIKADYPDKKSINFWSMIFEIPLNSFLCIKKLSMPKPNAFWKR